MARVRYVVLTREWNAGRWVTQASVVDERPAEGLAAFEVTHANGRRADVVAAVLEWLALGRPKAMAVRQLWPDGS